MKKRAAHISKTIYIFSLLTWLIHIAFIAVSVFLEIPAVWVVTLFFSVFIQGIVSGALSGDTAIPHTNTKRTFLDFCLNISFLVSAVFAVLGGISLLIAGGGPEIIDGSYFIVNNGEIVREVSSASLFTYFCICDFLIFNCGMLIFTSLMALRIRKLYLFQTSVGRIHSKR